MPRAARFQGVGQPLKVDETPKPSIGAGEVLLRVRAAGVCHTDLHMLDGVIPAMPNVTLGHEFAGEVEEVGAAVARVKVGDGNVVQFFSPCGACRHCLAGKVTQCERLFERPSYGGSRDGGFADYCAVEADHLVPIPKDLPFDFAATLGCAGLTAYHAVNTVGRVTRSDIVGIYGVGGVGSYAVQLAKINGAQVIAMDRRDEKLDMAKKFGADVAVNVAKGDLSDQIKQVTEARNLDAIVDTVANDESVRNYAGGLANGARIVFVGLGGRPVPLDPSMLVMRELSVSGSLAGTKEELAELLQLARSGKLYSAASLRFGLDEVNKAVAALRGGDVVGRATLVP